MISRQRLIRNTNNKHQFYVLNDCKSDEKCATSNKLPSIEKETIYKIKCCAHVRYQIMYILYRVGIIQKKNEKKENE